ncbi:MAG: cyclic nucleotide-binding domain-containing protein [Akkermansiaceae bacterium]
MFDIPARIRLVLAVAAVGGFIFIVMGSMAAGNSQQIHLDKLVHGIGYAILGLLVILSLPPVWYLPALFTIAIMGAGLEFVQGLILEERDADMMDALANVKGLALGACLGFLLRLAWNYIQKDLAAAADRKRMCSFKKGEVVFSEGDESDCLYVIKSGSVRISVDSADGENEISVLTAGEVLGEMGVVEKLPRSATATAMKDASLYRMEAAQIEAGEDGRDHPVLQVAQALAGRLREANKRVSG